MAAPPLVFDFVGQVFAAILYGLYCQLFGSYWRIQPKREDRWKGVLTVLFILSTLYFIIGIIMVQFFITISVLNQGSLLSAVDWMSVSLNALLIPIDFISQLILLYRCWTMWRQPLVMVIPCILLLASLAISLLALGFQIKYLADNLPGDWNHSIDVSVDFLSMGVNACATALILYKIYTIYNGIRGFDTSTSAQANAHGKDLNPLLSISIESGLITFIGRLIRSIMFNSAIAPLSLVRGSITMLYGIVSTAILVRVETGVSYDEHTSSTVDSADSGRPIQLWKVNH